MRTTVRATRGYLAGFGTSGSILAGAAVLFVLASAIVAFRGWPQIATGPATSSAGAPRLTAVSRVSKRLAVALHRRGFAGVGAAASAAGHRQAVRAVHGSLSGGHPATGSGRPVSSSPGGVAAAACGGTPCTQTNSPNLIARLTTTVGQAVTSIGSEVGSQVRGASGAAGGAVGGVSPQSGAAVQSAGSTAGGLVSGTASTAGSAIEQAGAGGH